MTRQSQSSVLPDSETRIEVPEHELKEASSLGSQESQEGEVQAQHDVRVLTSLIQLEGMARSAQSLKELQFLIVNETRRLIGYRQAILFRAGITAKKVYRIEAVSSLSAVERNAPFIRWLERILHGVRKKQSAPPVRRLSEADCPVELRSGWSEFSLPHVLWCPLRLSDNTSVGGVWLSRETPWQDGELTLVQRVVDTYAHAWGALAGRKKIAQRFSLSRILVWMLLVIVTAAMFIPVRLSTLAPAEVVALEPAIASAPMDGVIADILVPPNTPVSKGQVIFRYEDTNLRNQYAVAEKNLTITLAEYHKASQGAFLDAESGAQVPLLKTEVKLRQTERDYAKELLNQVEVQAARSGLLLYTDKSDWIGRPVAVGERIMEIADPNGAELRINLPVDDAMVLKEGAEVEVFFDANPLDKCTATLTHASYHAEVLPENVLAYRVTAQFNDTQSDVRIGWQGTAKIYGDEDVSLFFLLFRRPIGTIRQLVGL